MPRLTNIKRYFTAPFLVWVMCVGIALTPYRLLALPLLLIIASFYFPFPSKSSSIILRSVFIFLIYLCLIQVAGVLFWLLHVHLTWSWSIIPLYISAFIGLIKQPYLYRKFNIISLDDIAAFIISLASVLIIAGMTLNGGPMGQQLIRYLTTGFDNTAHLSLSLSVYDEQGYIYGPIKSTENRLIYKNLSAYPQGWHLTNSILWHGVTNDLNLYKSPKKVFAIYFATIMLWYGITVFLISRFTLALINRMKRSTSSLLTRHLATIVSSLLLQSMLLFSIIKFGFANYLSLICYLLAIVYYSVLVIDNPKKRRLNEYVLVGLLLCAGATFTWLLAAPIGFLFVLLVFVSFFRTPLKEIPSWIIKNPFTVLFALILLSVSFLQGALQLKYSVIPGNINADGGMWVMSYILFFSLLIGVIIFALRSYNSDPELAKAILISIASFGLIAGYINSYQFSTAGHSSYYATKISSLLFIVLYIFGSALAILALEKLSSQYGNLIISFLVLSLVFVIPLATNVDMRDIRFANGKDRKLSEYSSSQLMSLIYEKRAYSNNVFVVKELDYEEDVISTHFMNMLSRKDPECVQQFTWHQIAKLRQDELKDIVTCANQNKNTSYYVVASSKNIAELSSLFAPQHNIKTILSN